MWDCVGQEEKYWLGANGFIIMFDVTSKLSWKNCLEYFRKVRTSFPTLPIVVCGNKVDIGDNKVPIQVIRNFCNMNKCEYIDISAKSSHNCEKPLEYFVQH